MNLEDMGVTDGQDNLDVGGIGQAKVLIFKDADDVIWIYAPVPRLDTGELKTAQVLKANPPTIAKAKALVKDHLITRDDAGDGYLINPEYWRRWWIATDKFPSAKGRPFTRPCRDSDKS